ncbi:MAG: NAD(P)H-dependent glycerol-3-phosphate dehydrogenase [Dissulfurispiraceae bacterium]|jgi:glycerol-3-phosphate dehydrogenase (NAD(P)+)|nr:NAD(P)H-dependent glycerol-3-phosphate dehydrogenase [Dissulfurispiraceae bacterium]
MVNRSSFEQSYISVIGGGSWGTALASMLGRKGYDVMLWTFEQDVAEQINQERINSSYLPGVQLPDTLTATTSIQKAVSKARYIISVVPTQHIRRVFESAVSFANREAIVVSASKGIEITTLLTPSLILQEIFNRPAAALSGPSFASEVSIGLPTAVTLAVQDKKTGLLLQEIFNTDAFRVYTHNDVLGTEMGGALKNVIAIASGITAGLGLGKSALAALITRGLSEIVRLGVKLGADEITFSGLSGMGDLVLTCTSSLSRNYSVGKRLGQGETLEEITRSTKSVAEGVPTTISARELANKHGVEMPIVEQIYQTLYNNKPPHEALRDLMTRSLKSEFNAY